MNGINEDIVLDFYLEQMENDNIEFLKGRNYFKLKIKQEVIALKDAKDMHNKVEASKSLWKLLFEAAMSFIDSDKSGYDELFKFFDKYSNFEELIFASDSFYRDHTTHCLWVYFLGEYIYRNKEFSCVVYNEEEKYKPITNLKKVLEEANLPNLFDQTIEFCDYIINIKKLEDSVRCISSLTHDLGYPIKKINRINKSIKEVLPFFTINSYDEFNFQFTNEQDNFIKSFIELLSLDINVNFGNNKENKIAKKLLNSDNVFTSISINKDAAMNLTEEEIRQFKSEMTSTKSMVKNFSAQIRYSNDFEEYQHGIMSAFLLMKLVKAFRKIPLIYSDYVHMNVSIADIINVGVKQDIMAAIANHTSEGYQIKQISGISEFLTFVDELEEFSRISRANQNRQYINEFCKTEIYMENEVFNVDFIFDSDKIENLDPERAFKDKCKRFLTLFNISQLDEKLKLRVRFIGRLPYNNNTYALEIGRKYVNVTINGKEQDIPKYLNSREFYSKEEYSII